MSKEKVRVYILAREFNMESKDLLELCRQAGIDVKNQLSSLDSDQREAVENLVRRKAGGGGSTATAVLDAPPKSAPATPTVSVPPAAPPAGPLPGIRGQRGIIDLNQLKRRPQAAPAQPPQPAAPQAAPPAPAAASAASEAPPAEPAKAPEVPPAKPAVPQTIPPSKPPQLQPPRKTPTGERKPPAGGRPLPPVVGGLLAPPPKPKQSPPKEEKKPEAPAQKPVVRLTPELIKPGSGPIDVQKVIQKLTEQPKRDAPVDVEILDDDEDAGRPGGKKRPGVVPGRDERHKRRTEHAKSRRERDERVGLVRTDEEEEVRPRLKKLIRQKAHPKGPQPRKGKIPVETPITVRSLSEALGVRANDLLRKLLEHGRMANINAVLEPDLAEELALEFGAEIDVKRPLDPEEQLLAKLRGEDRPEDLVPRPPVVTVMGHVDHGKTSLLDRIRESNVVATEAGGITQHLRAWRVEHNGRAITFLDTPGHEAFTAMRARGANVTDIVVLVVAADDGVMPQTEEAISHAKAAGVPIVVAINKVDLPNANVNRTRQQLYGRELIPDDMGGDTPFVETVATKERARGIDRLLEMILVVAELEELKANPNKPGQGTCLEAKLSEGEGVVATLLVQDGTLRQGDVIICGTAYGRVRAMYDDLGRPISEAGPAMPVRVTGLDEVPNADDKFQVVPDLAQAREIAERRRERQRTAQPVKHATFRLEDLDKTEVEELKLILKADVRGSIEAIRKELEKLEHAEVRIHVLHTGIGAITEGDVQLALASPEDTMIVGFNVVPDDRARALAEERGVQIRQYDIIYQLTDDLRAALAGKLKPREEVVHLGRAVVRQTFKISRVGTVAGCYVTQGTIERSARVRVIREGKVVYPPPDRVATLESLKRIKDDVREVREGYDCGIKIANFDDIKVGDVIEAYRVEQVQRTLEGQ